LFVVPRVTVCGPLHLAIPTKKTDQTLIQHLSLTEMQAILNAPDTQTRSGLRDRAMMHVCFAAGLRVAELLSLPLIALTWQPTPTVHIEGKGRRHRALPLWKQTAEDVREWLAVRGDVSAPELFVSHQRRVMTRAGFNYVLNKHVKRAVQDCPSLKDKTISPHVLRHYLPFLTMSGNAKHFADMPGNYRSRRPSLDLRTRHSFLRLETVEKVQ
jgi:integrase/recombinase XerD